ncbi:cyclin family protein KNAG_0B02930 [Huiozyma naganishii CBS 8797]|uniref:Cyclin N-terminal domain-containing protein n=1 Tax=Huiozyma naganishii (strain ATCC MYA-139 / BCRC 22969 / CBS 8797 / KCTC 17520 / NBRC 10181 / NCYC 3082 / Yp74L-3) TaxID=1071383 RepID=J7R1P0_HUIN7|nr:hypothetical protein KNAG_0B02930 [Kazachstania naganishii CBS 8797]CCK68735.1 hypothetical protein KNAG_0B02930 [Kazachstania naganishii CBS 8797]
MSEYDALLRFNREPVSLDMIKYLAKVTESIVTHLRPEVRSSDKPPIPTLVEFIAGLVTNSKVGTPTLMASTVYLVRLKDILPPNIIGIETTRHRLFLGCLIIAAKTLNDNSPLNKHWSKHTNNLLPNREINIIERELLSYLRWRVTFSIEELISSLQPLLIPIRFNMYRELQKTNMLFFNPQDIAYRDTATQRFRVGNEACTGSVDSIPSIASKSSNESMKTLSTRDSEESVVISSLRDQPAVLPIDPIVDKSYKSSLVRSKKAFSLTELNEDMMLDRLESGGYSYHQHSRHESLIQKIRKTSWGSLFHLKA